MAALFGEIGGLLVLALVCAFCTALAAAGGPDAALLPLPVLGSCALVLLLGGYAGLLRPALILVYLLLLCGSVYFGVRGGKKAMLKALRSPGLCFFALAGAFFWVLFAVYRPMFTQWDEFTFWGTAARILKEQNMLYCAAPGNLAARAYLPGMALVSYLFQGFSGGFSEWQCLAAYDIFLMAAVAACSALPRRRWPVAMLLLAGGALLPLFFTAPVPGTPGIVYENAMGDLPLALQFGGVLCLYLTAGQRRSGLVFTGVGLAMLTLTKDMGFAYALILVFVIAWLRFLSQPKPTLRRFGGAAAVAAALAVPVLTVFISWSKYYGAVTGSGKEAVGSAQLGYGAILLGGAKQLLGIGREEEFAQLMQLMGDALFSVKVCLLGSGVMALAVITATAAAAWFFSEKGEARRRVVIVYASLAFCFLAFYLFHLILYFYNFAAAEALRLKDYARYIGPYYQGWMLAMLCLLGQSTLGTKRTRQAAGAVALLTACLMVAVGLRGVEAGGFWLRGDSRYELRRDVQTRAAAANEVLGWQDRVLVLSQGDDATRWYYYNYELTATVVRGFGGQYAGESKADRWDSDFMNLVQSLNWTLYDYQAVCTPLGLTAYMQEKDCNYLLIDRADDYLVQDFGDLFEGGLATDMPATLYRMETAGDTVRFVPVAESEAAK